MNNLSHSERRALEIMQKDNFRGISRENVIQLMSILDKVESDVAKAIIAQVPVVIRGIIETEQEYTNILRKEIDSYDASLDSCYKTEDDIIELLRSEIAKDSTSYEQKQYYFEKMEEAAKRKEAKDTEHRDTLISFAELAGKVFAFGLCIGAGIFIGKTNFIYPTNRMV